MDSNFKFNPNATEFKPGDTWYSLMDTDNHNDSTLLSDMNSLKIGDTSPTDSSKSKDSFSTKKKTTSSDSVLPAPDPRQHINIVFIGHVDAGKSTTCGNILYLSGYVDERMIEKYGKEAREKNRESWFLAFIMDTNEEERAKGKTIEVGRAKIETKNRRFTILDAPGHKNYVPNMIEGASQADCGVLIISARKGEFETGFERGGQTREHALLAKTLEGRDLSFVPISGLIGQNLVDHVSDTNYKYYDKNASWYDLSKPTLFGLLDSIPSLNSSEDAPLRIPIIDSYRDNGVMCLGKVESGIVRSGQNCILLPHKAKVKIANIYFEEEEYAFARFGENIWIRISGSDEEQFAKGSVICNVDAPCPVVLEFVALISVVDLLEHRPLITSGYYCMFHAHCISSEVKFVKLLEIFVSNNTIVTAHLELTHAACLETFEACAQLGRFTLRDEDKTIAIGKIIEIKKTE